MATDDKHPDMGTHTAGGAHPATGQATTWPRSQFPDDSDDDYLEDEAGPLDEDAAIATLPPLTDEDRALINKLVHSMRLLDVGISSAAAHEAAPATAPVPFPELPTAGSPDGVVDDLLTRPGSGPFRSVPRPGAFVPIPLLPSPEAAHSFPTMRILGTDAPGRGGRTSCEGWRGGEEWSQVYPGSDLGPLTPAPRFTRVEGDRKRPRSPEERSHRDHPARLSLGHAHRRTARA